MKFSIKDFFSKCDQIWSHLLKKSLMENFIFCAVSTIIPSAHQGYPRNFISNKAGRLSLTSWIPFPQFNLTVSSTVAITLSGAWIKRIRSFLLRLIVKNSSLPVTNIKRKKIIKIEKQLFTYILQNSKLLGWYRTLDFN